MTPTRTILVALVLLPVAFVLGFLAPGGTTGLTNTVGSNAQTASVLDVPVGQSDIQPAHGYGQLFAPELSAMDADPTPGADSTCLILAIADLTDPAYIQLVNAGWTGIQDGRALIAPDC